MPKYILGYVKNGLISVTKVFVDDLKKAEGKPVEIIIEPRSIKTKAQLGYLWAVIFPIVSDYTGFTPDEVYQMFVEKYGPKYYKTVNGKIYEFKKTLSGMTRKECSEFIDAILKHIYESETLRHLEIPPPDPDWYMK